MNKEFNNSIVLRLKKDEIKAFRKRNLEQITRLGGFPGSDYALRLGADLGVIDEGEMPRRVYFFNPEELAIGGEAQVFFDSEADTKYIHHRLFMYTLYFVDIVYYNKPLTLSDVGLKHAPSNWSYAKKEIIL